MGIYDFDHPIDRRILRSMKWTSYPEDVLPLWVADMDFQSPPIVAEVIKRRADTLSFGYTADDPQLVEVIRERLLRLYQWEVKPEDIVFLPGLVPMFTFIPRVLGQEGDSVLTQTPIYHHFLSAPPLIGQSNTVAELQAVRDGQNLHYEIDFETFDSAIRPTTRLFTLCNPHNPVGRSFTRDELSRMAEICLKHRLLIVSDEIHCDLLYDGVKHIPIASLSDEIARNTITLMAPSKVFNLPGLKFAFAVIQNKDIRQRVKAMQLNLVGGINIFGQEAALAVYQHGQDWLNELLVYLQGNRDFLVEYVRTHMPQAAVTCPEATYLGWLDFREYAIPENNPQQFFLSQAKVALNPGAEFGENGHGFARINFGTRRALLEEALERMRHALETL